MHKNTMFMAFNFHPESISTKVGMKLIKKFYKKIKMSNLLEKLQKVKTFLLKIAKHFLLS